MGRQAAALAQLQSAAAMLDYRINSKVLGSLLDSNFLLKKDTFLPSNYDPSLLKESKHSILETLNSQESDVEDISEENVIEISAADVSKKITVLLHDCSNSKNNNRKVKIDKIIWQLRRLWSEIKVIIGSDDLSRYSLHSYVGVLGIEVGKCSPIKV